MNDDRDLIRDLQEAVPRWPDDGPPAGLWPRVLRRLDDAPPRFGWLDAALVAAAVAVFLIYPETIPVLLWHL